MITNWKKNTTLFLIGQAVSAFGSMVVQFAIFWYVTLETKSGTTMMVFTLVSFLPMFLISPFGGVWADRFDRKRLIAIADCIIAFVSLLMALSLMTGRVNFGLLLACAAIRALGQGVHMPTVGAVIQQIVPEEHLTKVNGIQSSVLSLCQLAAPAAAGVLMNVFPLEAMFFLDVVTAVFGISILLVFVKIPPKISSTHVGVDGSPTTYFHDLKAGLRYIRSHGFVKRLLIFQAVFTVLIAPIALLTPLQVVRNFGDEVWRLTAIEIAFSSGMIAGGLLIAAWGGFRNRMYTVALSCFVTGLVALSLGVTPLFWAYLCIMAVGGITVPLANTPLMVTLQSKVEAEFMGRVLSVFTMISSSAMPLAMLLFGPLSDRISIDILLMVTGILITIQSVSLITSKTLRAAGV